MLGLDIDLSKNSLSSLHKLGGRIDEEKYLQVVRVLNLVGFERTNSNSSSGLSDKSIIINNEISYCEENHAQNIIPDLWIFEEKRDEKERNYRSARRGSTCSRKRRNSADYLFSCFKNYDVDMNGSYLEEVCDQGKEEANFQTCFHNLFTFNDKPQEVKGNEDEDQLEVNNLMFISSINVQNSESSSNDKYDLMSLVEQEVANNYLKKKRQLFQVINGKNIRKPEKAVKRKLRFLTYNVTPKKSRDFVC